MRYLIIIGLFAAWLVGWLPAVWCVPLLFSCCLLLRTHGHGPGRRRGGYIKPPASSTRSPETPTRLATRIAEATSSSSGGRGVLSEAEEIRSLQALRSSGTGRGSSGAALAGRLGLPPEDADSSDCGCEGAA